MGGGLRLFQQMLRRIIILTDSRLRVQHELIQLPADIFERRLLVNVFGEALAHLVAVVFEIEVVVHEVESGKVMVIPFLRILLPLLEILKANRRLLQLIILLMIPLSLSIVINQLISMTSSSRLLIHHRIIISLRLGFVQVEDFSQFIGQGGILLEVFGDSLEGGVARHVIDDGVFLIHVDIIDVQFSDLMLHPHLCHDSFHLSVDFLLFDDGSVKFFHLHDCFSPG